MFLSFIILIIFAIGMLTAAIKDALTMTIPNWASVFVLMGFFLVIPFVWQGWSVFGLHMLTGLGMFVFGFVLFAMGWLGGGDAKLMAATSFWWMPQDLFLYVFYTTAAGGSLAILIMFGRQFIPAKVLTTEWIHRLIKDEKHMPYGLALAFGALVTLPQSTIFKAAVTIG